MWLLPHLLARAGGGHSFSGGGGGGGGGGGFGGGGGGGFYFFGGRGAGGVGILVFLVLVVLAFVFMAAIYGSRRRGRSAFSAAGSDAGSDAGSGGGLLSEQQVESWGRPTVPDLGFRGDLLPGSGYQHDSAQPLQAGLEAIRAHDPAFDDAAFVADAQRAFFVVEEAWTELKPDMSRRVMADGLWQQHRVQIEQYINTHRRNVLEDLAVGNATIIAAHTDQSYDTVVVRFLAACADYDIDTDTNKTVRGNRRVGQWQEDWTFQRSSDATTKAGGGTLSEKCPNCGAPLTVDLQGVCHYCKASIMSGKYDWVLARISQVP